MLGNEPIVCDALMTNRPGEGAADGHLSLAPISHSCGRVALVSDGMAPIVDESLGGAVPLDQAPDSASPPPSVRALATGVGAVDPAASRPMDVVHGRAADRTGMFADDVAERREDGEVAVGTGWHAASLTNGCGTTALGLLRGACRFVST